MAPPPTDDLRVYLLGAHSTGKTTLARWISDTYKLPLITEVARTVLAEMGTTLHAMHIDLERTKMFQFSIAARQVQAELTAGNRFVSDRACDNLAYAAQHTISLKEILDGFDLPGYLQRLRHERSVVFFVRPHASLLAHDGTRKTDWDEIQQLDGMIRYMLECYDVDYVSLATPSMVDRVRTVRAVLKPLVSTSVRK